jgi:hypothetical protein
VKYVTRGAARASYTALVGSKRETAMRRLIESLNPAEQRIHWKWVGTVFAVYVLAMAAAIGMIVSHQSSGNARHDTATAGKTRSLGEAPIHFGQLARFE